MVATVDSPGTASGTWEPVTGTTRDVTALLFDGDYDGQHDHELHNSDAYYENVSRIAAPPSWHRTPRNHKGDSQAES